MNLTAKKRHRDANVLREKKDGTFEQKYLQLQNNEQAAAIHLTYI